MNWLKHWLPRGLTGLAAVVFGLALGRNVLLFLNYLRILIAFPYNVDYGEGPILDQVIRLSRFQSIYPTDISHLPFTIGNYPPLYHLLQLPFVWIFGPAFWYGRVINLLSLLAAAVFIGLIIYRLTKDWIGAIAGGAFLLSISYILHWSGFVRVDSLALGVSWAGLWAAVCWPERRKNTILVALFLTAAVYTRQSYGLAAPFAAFVWFLSSKPRWRAFELAGWTGGFSLILFLLLNGLSGGGFYFNIVTANVNPFFWDTVKNYWNGMWEHIPSLLVLCGIYVALAVWFRQKAWWLAAPYLLAASASAITIGKDGSNVNYLFEFSAALALLAGLIVAWFGIAWQEKQWVGKRWWLKAAVMLLLAYQVTLLYDWSMRDYYKWPTDRVANERADIAEMTAMIREANGPVLADEFMGLIPLGGKSLVFQPFEYKQLSIGKVWDEENFLTDISERKFAVILLYDPSGWDSRGARWTPAQLKAIEKNYVLKQRLAQTRVYLPRQR